MSIENAASPTSSRSFVSLFFINVHAAGRDDDGRARDALRLAQVADDLFTFERDRHALHRWILRTRGLQIIFDGLAMGRLLRRVIDHRELGDAVVGGRFLISLVRCRDLPLRFKLRALALKRNSEFRPFRHPRLRIQARQSAEDRRGCIRVSAAAGELAESRFGASRKGRVLERIDAAWRGFELKNRARPGCKLEKTSPRRLIRLSHVLTFITNADSEPRPDLSEP